MKIQKTLDQFHTDAFWYDFSTVLADTCVTSHDKSQDFSNILNFYIHFILLFKPSTIFKSKISFLEVVSVN